MDLWHQVSELIAFSTGRSDQIKNILKSIQTKYNKFNSAIQQISYNLQLIIKSSHYRSMSLLAKLSQSKPAISIFIASFSVGFFLYRYFKQELPEEKRFKQILLLKSQINTQDPSRADIEKIISLSKKRSQQLIDNRNKQIQQKRSKFNKQNLRDKNTFKEYLSLVISSISQLQSIAVDEIFRITAQLGVSALVLRKYQNLIQQSLVQVAGEDQLLMKDRSQVNVEEVRAIMKKQIAWAKKQGDFYVNLMIECIKGFSQKQRKDALDLYRYVRADIILEEYPNMRTVTYLNAKEKYLDTLIGEYQQLQIAQVLSINKLNAALRANDPEDEDELNIIKKQMMEFLPKRGYQIKK